MRQQEPEAQEADLGLFPNNWGVNALTLNIAINAEIQARLNHLAQRVLSPSNHEPIFSTTFHFKYYSRFFSFSASGRGNSFPINANPTDTDPGAPAPDALPGAVTTAASAGAPVPDADTPARNAAAAAPAGAPMQIQKELLRVVNITVPRACNRVCVIRPKK